MDPSVPIPKKGLGTYWRSVEPENKVFTIGIELIPNIKFFLSFF